MISYILSVPTPPVQERGWIVEILATDDSLHRKGLGKKLHEDPLPYFSRQPQWRRLNRRFACKRYALVAMRREIRTGAALAAKLYWGGNLKAHWGRDPLTGRELKMKITPAS